MTRALLVLVPPVGGRGVQGFDVIRTRLLRLKGAVQDDVNRHVDEIRRTFGLQCAEVVFDVIEEPAEATTVAAAIAGLKRSDIRIYADLAELGVDKSIEAPSGLGLSHLVSLSTTSKSSHRVWRGGAPPSLAHVVLDVDSLRAFLVDVLLDIAMFYAWPQLADELPDTKARQELSSAQVSYAMSGGLTSTYYGVIDDSNRPLYLTFAALARTKPSFDCEAIALYVNIWVNFIETFMAGRFASAVKNHGLQRKKIVRLLGRQKAAGQISEDKLLQALDACPPGIYWLVRLRRKAVGAKRLARLNTLLLQSGGGSQIPNKGGSASVKGRPRRPRRSQRPLHVGTWRLVSPSDVSRFLQDADFLTMSRVLRP